MKVRMWAMLTMIMTVVLAGQLILQRSHNHADHNHGAQAPYTAHASWMFHPKTFAEARDKATTAVLAEVIGVQPGADLVANVPGMPNDEHRVPTQRVTVKVLKAYKGTAKRGELLTIFQTGGKLQQAPAAPDVVPAPDASAPDAAPQLQPGDRKKPVVDPQHLGPVEQGTIVDEFYLEGDPPYQPGERYLLLLEPGPDQLLRSIAPQGRFKQARDGKLVPMVNGPATDVVRGKPFSTVERAVRGEENIDLPASVGAIGDLPASDEQSHNH